MLAGRHARLTQWREQYSVPDRGEAEEQKFQARLVINTVTADVPIEDREMVRQRTLLT